ncbi:hypothetical protein ACIBG0_10545 [Nocardia sp. NPDC050630]|uniref:hypothetical protein n=1 Tax=Nocardia sp. NPDC050630 TaxID=3364321 RepID=UPI0037B0BCC3
MSTPNERLRAAMREAQLTPQTVAERLEVDPKTVERWISSGRVPYPKHQHSVSVMVGVSTDDLWPDRPNKPVNEQLQQAVLDAGMTPEQLAQKLHVTSTQVRRWIQRGTVPYPRHQSAIAEAVQVPEDQLWPDRLSYHVRAKSEFRLRTAPLEPPSAPKPHVDHPTRYPDHGFRVSARIRNTPNVLTPARERPQLPDPHVAARDAQTRMRELMSWIDTNSPLKERDIHPHREPERPHNNYSRGYGVERSR